MIKKGIKFTGVEIRMAICKMLVILLTLSCIASGAILVISCIASYEVENRAAGDTYTISDADDLFKFAERVNDGETSLNAVLTADINANGEKQVVLDNELANGGVGFRKWIPIGTSSYQYSGTFDGCGYTIKGLYFNEPNDTLVGLFGYIGTDGVVKNVKIEDSYFCSGGTSGGIAGENHGTVKNCMNSATSIVKCTLADNSNNVIGGIVGRNNQGTVRNCLNAGRVDGKGKYIGGVVGRNSSAAIINC